MTYWARWWTVWRCARKRRGTIIWQPLWTISRQSIWRNTLHSRKVTLSFLLKLLFPELTFQKSNHTCIRSFLSLLPLLSRVAIQILPVLNTRRSARCAHGDWGTAMEAPVHTSSTASVGAHLVVCQAFTPASEWFLSPRIPSAAMSTLEGLVTRLCGNFMLT